MAFSSSHVPPSNVLTWIIPLGVTLRSALSSAFAIDMYIGSDSFIRFFNNFRSFTKWSDEPESDKNRNTFSDALLGY